MNSEKVIEVLDKICDKLIENEELLTSLDRKIGDGDHGINIKRGFEEIKKSIPNYQDKPIKDILNACAMTLMTKVGGSSGPLLATAFMRAAMYDNFKDMLNAAVKGIEDRGKASVGEKTMVDVLRPAADLYTKLLNEGKSNKEALEMVLIDAKKNLDHTKEYKATKGRASYIGDRSIGVEDPGAYTAYLILSVIYKECI